MNTPDLPNLSAFESRRGYVDTDENGNGYLKLDIKGTVVWYQDAAELRGELLARIAELEAANERLKVCGNCHWIHCDFDDCTDDVDGELPGGCSPADPCHFTPSRWTRGDAS